MVNGDPPIRLRTPEGRLNRTTGVRERDSHPPAQMNECWPILCFEEHPTAAPKVADAPCCLLDGV
eukprot:10973339-Alexandrium_andersonii.AAC.1